MGVVFGHRTQLWWNLPIRDSFDLFRTIYKIDAKKFKQRVDMFSAILEFGDFYTTPLRQLSLGQRMRVEIAVSLLHEPKIVYLDEPTIGLDVVAKLKIREFIKQINKETNTTILLTTHDMMDIEKLCKRIIIINTGKLVYDGDINSITNKYAGKRRIIIDLESPAEDKKIENGIIINSDEFRKEIEFDSNKNSAMHLITELSKKYNIKDFKIEEMEIEKIIENIYKS